MTTKQGCNCGNKIASEEDPCWEGYEMMGMKMKDGKEVPNCVPKKESSKTAEFKRGVVDCQTDGKPGYRADYDSDWHKDSQGKGGGKCFTYTSGDESQRKLAKMKAYKQLYAIEKSLGVYASTKAAELEAYIDPTDFMSWMSQNFAHDVADIEVIASKKKSSIPQSIKVEAHIEKKSGTIGGQTADIVFPGLGKVGVIELNPHAPSSHWPSHNFIVYGLNIEASDPYLNKTLGTTHYGSGGQVSVLKENISSSDYAWVKLGKKSQKENNVKKKSTLKKSDMNKNFSDTMANDFVDATDDVTAEADSVHQQQMADTAKETDIDNRTPDKSVPNPSQAYQAQKKGFRTKQVNQTILAQVAVDKKNFNKTIVGSKVFIKAANTSVAKGRIVAVGTSEFAVEWQDKKTTVEPKSEYIIIEAK